MAVITIMSSPLFLGNYQVPARSFLRSNQITESYESFIKAILYIPTLRYCSYSKESFTLLQQSANQFTLQF